MFSRTTLRQLFPPQRTDAFFDALFGDASEGAYDIELSFDGYDPHAKTLRFLLNLRERPGCCLACNLTYGLPEVFARHPVIDLKGMVRFSLTHRLQSPMYSSVKFLMYAVHFTL